jgi:IS5 family transposase
MYRKRENQPELEAFVLPFGGLLDPDNRWVKLATIIPWGRVEERYAEMFAKEGAPAKSCRVALGALIVKERLQLSDEETVEQIKENPYLQYFLGYEGFTSEALFDASMLVHFRKRLSAEVISQVNEWIHEGQMKREEEKKGKEKREKDPPDKGVGGNHGQLLVDATCAPQDIRYPTDVSLLAEAREKTERVIDVLYAPLRGEMEKPRTYRREARKKYVGFVKKRKPGKKAIRRALREQLQYVRRNLRIIGELAPRSSLKLLSRNEYRALLVCGEVYRQQEEMYRQKTNRISGRIVSIAQPHVRPIVRGKSGVPVEFGAKVSVSLVNGFAFVDRIGWDPYHEAADLPEQIEHYRARFGFYPASVHADQLYRTRNNRAYCLLRNIRFSGPKLGRPYQDGGMNDKLRRELKRIERNDEGVRNAVEGKFGQVKRKYNIDRIYEKLPATSETAIMLGFLVANLAKVLKDFLRRLFAAMFFNVSVCPWGRVFDLIPAKIHFFSKP